MTDRAILSEQLTIGPCDVDPKKHVELRRAGVARRRIEPVVQRGAVVDLLRDARIVRAASLLSSTSRKALSRSD